MITRIETKKVLIGGVAVGADAPVAVQSMNNTDTRDVEGTLRQIEELKSCGCDITRVAILNMEAAEALKAAGADVKFSAWPGGHEWQPWRKSLHEFVQLLFK